MGRDFAEMSPDGVIRHQLRAFSAPVNKKPDTVAGW